MCQAIAGVARTVALPVTPDRWDWGANDPLSNTGAASKRHRRIGGQSHHRRGASTAPNRGTKKAPHQLRALGGGFRTKRRVTNCGTTRPCPKGKALPNTGRPLIMPAGRGGRSVNQTAPSSTSPRRSDYSLGTHYVSLPLLVCVSSSVYLRTLFFGCLRHS